MTGVSQKSYMWNLSDNLDKALNEPVSTDEVVAEKLDLFNRLFGKKLDRVDHYQDYEDDYEYEKEDDPDESDAENSYEEYGIEDDKPVENTKASQAPTMHVKSYAVARGKGFLRVAVEGDKSLTKARLHIFKKGNRYFGFLVIPGPGRKAESFQIAMDEVLYESVSDIVLKYDSDDLEDLFNLSNYTKRSSLESDKFGQYEEKVDILDQDTAKKTDVGRLPWGKDRRQEISGEEPSEIDDNVIQKLIAKYEQMADDSDDAYDKAFYENLYSSLPKVTSKEQIEYLISSMNKAIKKYSKINDDDSGHRIEMMNYAIDDLSSILESLL